MVVRETPQRHYPVARVVEVHDGDTLKLEIDCGFSTLRRIWIRLLDVRAPELAEPGGHEAKRAAEDWLAIHSPGGYVSVITYLADGAQKVKEIHERMTFIRYVGMVIAEDGLYLNEWLRSQGYVDKGL